MTLVKKGEDNKKCDLTKGCGHGEMINKCKRTRAPLAQEDPKQKWCVNSLSLMKNGLMQIG